MYIVYKFNVRYSFVYSAPISGLAGSANSDSVILVVSQLNQLPDAVRFLSLKAYTAALANLSMTIASSNYSFGMVRAPASVTDRFAPSLGGRGVASQPTATGAATQNRRRWRLRPGRTQYYRWDNQPVYQPSKGFQKNWCPYIRPVVTCQCHRWPTRYQKCSET